jgi:hypothetical protein
VCVDKDRVDAIGLHFLHIRQDNIKLFEGPITMTIYVCGRVCGICALCVKLHSLAAVFIITPPAAMTGNSVGPGPGMG